ncbi:hypothetical protein ASE99_15420 [Serratia sp. Leaf51]|nr:hypothetical protein ASE99_15420 [Serratia sp. Leaf51]
MSNSVVPTTLRIHCVSVRLNNKELTKLNSLRGSYAKGEWLRMTFNHELPAIVPSINVATWKSLAEINQKLSRIVIHLDSKSDSSTLTKTEIYVVKRQISELRDTLLKTKLWSPLREGNAEDQTR